MSGTSLILAFPLFWRDDRILQFWVALCECLKQSIPNQTKNKTQLENLGSAAKTPIFPWYNKFNPTTEPIKEYLQLLTKHSPQQEKYNEHNLFDLLRAHRNLNVHIYGSEISQYKKYKKHELKQLTTLRSTIRTVLKNEGIKFWIEKFPELLLITYSVGYDLSKNSKDDIGPEFGNTFFRDFQSWTLPATLDNFVQELDEWIKAEVTDQKTAHWKYSFETEKATITFLNIPLKAIVDLESREMLTIRCSSITTAVYRFLQITRNKISTEQEATCLLIPDEGTKIAQDFYSVSKTINLKFQPRTEFPFVAFTDMISAALAVCFEQIEVINNTDKKTCIIFTNNSTDRIKNIVEKFCHTRKIKNNAHTITWGELRLEYQKFLLDQIKFPFHKNSEKQIELRKIIKNVGNDTSTLVGDALLRLMHKRSDGLLQTYLEKKKPVNPQATVANNQSSQIQPLINRKLSNFSDDTQVYNENEFLNRISKQTKKLYFISGIAGMGKSTFLAKLGCLLRDDFVLLLSCKQIHKESTSWSWLNNKFEEMFLGQYILKLGNCKMTLLFDELDLLNHEEQHNFVLFLEYLFDFYGNIITNIFLATRSNDIFTHVSCNNTLKNLQVTMHHFKLCKLDSNEKVEYITSFCWKPYIRQSNDQIGLVLLAEEIIRSTSFLGYFADTPFACKFLSKMYEHRAINPESRMKSEYFLSDSELCGQFQNIHLKNEFSKNLLKPSIPKEFQVNMASVDTKSPIFKLFKKSILTRYYNKSLNIRFPKCFDEKISVSTPILETTCFYGNFIDLTYWEQTSLPDYYCALFIFENKHLKYFKENTASAKAFLKRLFNFGDGKFRYYKVLFMLNTMLEKQPTLSPFGDHLPENFDNILHKLLCSGLKYIFTAATSSINIKVLKFYGNLRSDNATEIIHTAIKHGVCNTVKVLVEIFDYDVKNTNREARNLLHLILKNTKKNTEMLEYLLKKGADISVKNNMQQSVLTSACCLDLDPSIRDNILDTLVEYGDTASLSTELENCKSVNAITDETCSKLSLKLANRLQ